MSDQWRPMQLVLNDKTSVAVETLPNGYPCFVMPAEMDIDGERLVFLPKVRIVGNLDRPDSNGYLMPKVSK